MLYKQTTYLDDQGTAIYELTPAPGTQFLPRLKPKFFAMGSHVLNVNGRPLQDQFRIDIEAETITEAFEKLPDRLLEGSRLRVQEVAAQAEAMAEQQRRQIVLPSGQQLPPKGNPRTRMA